MAEIRINATGGVKLYDADDSHYAQIIAGTITSNVDAITLGHDVVSIVDNLALTSDSAVLKFGADNDTTLTHTDGTGLTLNSTNKLCFNDASQFVQGSSATVLSIGATDEIDLTATAVDINGTCDISGTFSLGGTNITTTAAEINLIDGGTSRGTTAIADGDGVLINDAGTMRMTTVQTLATYIGGGIDCDADAWQYHLSANLDQNSAAVIDFEGGNGSPYKLGSNVTESGGVITVGTAGWYYVECCLANNGAATDATEVYFRKESSNIGGRILFSNFDDIDYGAKTMSFLIEASANDTFDMYGTGHWFGSNSTVGTTYFMGIRLGA